MGAFTSFSNSKQSGKNYISCLDEFGCIFEEEKFQSLKRECLDLYEMLEDCEMQYSVSNSGDTSYVLNYRLYSFLQNEIIFLVSLDEFSTPEKLEVLLGPSDVKEILYDQVYVVSYLSAYCENGRIKRSKSSFISLIYDRGTGEWLHSTR